MSSYIIKGGNKLEGTVTISGSKNAALPIIAGCILNKGKTILYNVPNIHDTQMMYEIIKILGGTVQKKKNKVIIDTSKISKYEIPDILMHKMRSSVIIVGAILGRYRTATFSYPGGCDIGARPIDLHLKAFEKLGVSMSKSYGKITCECLEKGVIGNKIDLDFPSVGATENSILASVLAKGKTVITNAAREPEIVDLQEFLNKMGAKIEGAGTDKIEIEGVRELKEISYNIMPDRIETGTFLCLAAITGGKLQIEKTNPNHVTPVISKLEEAGCYIEVQKEKIKIEAPKRLKSIDIKTMPYPGFPTDMQSIMAATFTVAKGTTLIVENIFESRYKYVQELNKMGAKITVEGKSAIIRGTRKLYGANIKATDLRGGAALVLAGLVAKGITVIENIEYILRGYEGFDEKIRKLGGNIEITKAF